MHTLLAISLAVLLLPPAAAGGEDTETGSAAAEVDARLALRPLQDFVGAWKRGVGQVRRGSTRGAWIEEADWAWHFDDRGAAIEFRLKDGKYFRAGRLTPAGDGLKLTGTLPDGKTKETYTGALGEDGRLVLVADSPAADRPARISLRLVAQGKRLLMLYERRIGETDRFLRMAEVGYTREGSGFGQGVVRRECVVTGGAGTIPVTYKGKTYYVCCTGCRDYFNDNPETVLAEYAARKKAEREKREKR